MAASGTFLSFSPPFCFGISHPTAPRGRTRTTLNLVPQGPPPLRHKIHVYVHMLNRDTRVLKLTCPPWPWILSLDVIFSMHARVILSTHYQIFKLYVMSETESKRNTVSDPLDI